MARILIADDDESIRKLLRKSLEREGHAVEEASNGDEAIEACRKQPPDLLVTDILMPAKGGLVVILELRRLYPYLKIIAISGGGSGGRLNFLATASSFPGVETLEKPFTLAEFNEVVDDLLAV